MPISSGCSQSSTSTEGERKSSIGDALTIAATVSTDVRRSVLKDSKTMTINRNKVVSVTSAERVERMIANTRLYSLTKDTCAAVAASLEDEDEREYLRMRIMEEQAAHRIQLLFRLRQLLFERYGSSLFCMRNGRSAAYGRLFFETAPSARPFLVVSETASIPLLSTFLCKAWSLPRPEVLITVTGGAMDFALSSSQLAAFDYGLYTAASATSAWIFSAGSDAGVMKLVGKALRGQSTLPLIGVFPLGVTHGKELIVASKSGKVVNYSSPAKPAHVGARLNPDHTHFVLVDNGKEGAPAFGGEIKLRAGLEAYIAQSKGVPIVQLVVQGGPGTIATVRATAEALNPIVILTDSGGAAEAIYEYIVNGALPERLSKFESQQEHIEQIKAMNDKVGEKLLTFAKLEDGNQLATSMLTAVLRMFSIRPAEKEQAQSPGSGPQDKGGRSGEDDLVTKMIMLAVSWNRPEIVRGLLSQLSANATVAVEGRTPLLARALQRGLELHFPGIFEVLVEVTQDTLIRHISMPRLYLRALNQDFDGHRFMQKNKASCAFLIEHSKEIHDVKTTQELQHELYHEFMLPFVGKMSFMLERSIASTTHVRVHDLFYWAIMIGSDEFAYLLWQQCDKPAHTALLGSLLCKNIARRTSAGSAKNRLLERAERMEGWAVGILDHSFDEKMARDIISTNLVAHEQYHLADVGLHGQMKQFLNHQFCVGYMDLEWRGDSFGSAYALPEGYSPFQSCFDLLLPVRHLSCFQKRHKSTPMPKGERVAVDLVMVASVKSHLLGNEERRRAVAGDVHSPSVTEETMDDGSNELSQSRSATRRSILRHAPKQQRNVTDDLPNTDAVDVAKPESRLHAFYKVPAVIFQGRLLAHLLWLVVYLSVISTTETAEELDTKLAKGDFLGASALDVLWFIFHVGNFVDQRHSFLKSSFHRNIVHDRWWGVWLVVDFLFLVSLTTRILAAYVADNDVASDLFVTYQVIVSIIGGLVLFLTMRYFSRWQAFGVLVTVVRNMVDDISTFLTIFLIVLGSFCITFMGLERVGWYSQAGQTSPDPFGVHGSFWAPAWAVYGYLSIDNYLGFTASITPWLMWLYMLISSVVMVNLLVAMMADTYARVSQSSVAEYTFQEWERIFSYRHIHHMMPPPFNLPFALYEVIGVRFGFYKLRRKPTPEQSDLSDGSQAQRQYIKASAKSDAEQVSTVVLVLQQKIEQLERKLLG